MSRNAARVLDWNGHDLPGELASLPPGRYVLEPLESVEEWGLTPEQVEGLEEGVRSLEQGKGVPAPAAFERVQQKIAKIASR